MNNRLYSIQEVANILGVSTKTLRRWDQRGRFVPTRTIGNQRRYSQEQIEKFKSSTKNAAPALNAPPLFPENEAPKELKAARSLPSALSSLPSGSFLKNHFLARGPVRSFPPASAPATAVQMRAVGSPSSSTTPRIFNSQPSTQAVNPVKIGFVFGMLVLFLSFAGAVILVKYNVVAGLSQTRDHFAKFISNLPQISLQIKSRDLNGDLSFVPQQELVGAVLAATSGDDLLLKINVPVVVGTRAQEPSAIFSIFSEDKGFLAPRMTEAQIKAIASPAAGLFVYNTDINHYNMYNGTSWEGVFTSIGDSTTGEAFTETGTSGTALYFYDADGRGQVTIANLSGVRTYTLPDASGEVSLLGQTISNAELVNAKVTVTPGTNLTGGGEVALGSSVTLTLKDSLVLSGALTAGGATLLNGNTGVGDAITDTITFTGRVAEGSDLIPIGTTGTNDLGTSSLPWDNIYADSLFAAASGNSGHWQRNLQALSPTNITDDVLLGATSTSSAKFGFINVGGGSPTATISGNLSLVVPTTAGANTFNLLKNSSLNFQRSVGGDAGLATALYIQNSGNVGIGTTAPTAALTIDQTGTGDILNLKDGGTTVAQWPDGARPIFTIPDDAGFLNGEQGLRITTETPDAGNNYTVNGVNIWAKGDTGPGFMINLFKAGGAAPTIAELMLGGGSPLTSTSMAYMRYDQGMIWNAELNSSNDFIIRGQANNVFAVDAGENRVAIGTIGIGSIGGSTAVSLSVVPFATAPSGATSMISSLFTTTGSVNVTNLTGNFYANEFAYNTLTATSAKTIANAATVLITDPIQQGSNVTITNPYALWVAAGTSRFDGAVNVQNTTDSTSGSTGSINTLGGLGVTKDLAVDGGDIVTAATTFNLVNATATTISFAGAATTALNIGNGNTAYTAINIGSGTGGNTINIAGTGATGADTVNIATGGTGADTINIGSSASTTAVNVTTGTGVQTYTSNVATGSTTTSGFVFDATAITSGTGIYAVTDSVTTGRLLDIATSGNTWTGNGTTNGLINIASTSTAGTASSQSILLNLARSGANANTAHTAYGIYSNVTNTNATSGTNIGGYFTASGATTANYGLIVAAGNVGIGDTTPAALFAVGDGDDFQIDSTGDITLNQTTPNIAIGNTGTLTITDGTNTLFSIADDTSEGDVTITGDLAVNGATSADITSTTTTGTLFNTTVTTLSLGGAATTLNLGTTDSVTRTINLGTGTGADTINIGTGATGADAITIGNNASTSSLAFTSGTGSQTHTSSVVSGTTTTSANVFVDTALTSGTLIYGTSSSLTSGMLANLTLTGSSVVASAANSGSLLTLTSTTTGFTGATQRLAGIFSSGANTNASAVAQGLAISVTNTGTTNTNTALLLTASGASTANNAIDITAGILKQSDTTDSTSGSTGSINTLGGLGVTKDLAVDGGDIVTAATTFNLVNATATTVSFAGGATTALNIGNGNTAYTAINIGSGTGGNTINIAGTGATGADTINIGSGGTGADTINIGSSASTTAVNVTTGTGVQTYTSNVATGSTTTSGFVFDATAITSGTGIYAVTDSVTTGRLLDIATSGNTWTGNGTTNGLINIASTSTAGTASSQSILLNLARSGANANTAHTAYGIYSNVTNTNATSGTNIAGYLSASGATTANYGLIVANGNVGIGTTSPGSRLTLADDLIAGFGSDSDIAFVNRSTSLAANTALTGVLIGTPVTTAIPANSLIASNITANGDIGFYLNSNAGNSWEYLRFDGSARETVFNDASSDIDFRIESDGNENVFFVDASRNNVGVGANAAQSRVFEVAGSFTPVAGTYVRGSEFNAALTAPLNADEANQVGIDGSIILTTGSSAIGRVGSIDIVKPGITANGVTINNAYTVRIESAPTEGTNNYALWVDAGTSRFDGAVTYGSQATFTDSDATPDVSAGSHFITNTTAVTITDFDAGAGTLQAGHVIYVESNGAITYDFDAGGFNLGAADIVTAAKDITVWIYDGTDWNLINWMDTSDTQTGADIAELFPSQEQLEPGDVVVADTGYPVNVKKSAAVYEKQLIGIVSTEPAITLGQGIGGNTYPVALAGRVPVKVSLENGPIAIGDFLTSSSIPGVAMRASAAGNVIGTALGAYDGTQEINKITVFVNIGWQGNEKLLALDGNNNLGIGTTTPSFKLDIADMQIASPAARIFNTATGTDADGLVIKLGNDSATAVATTNHFISFETSGIGIVGSIQGNGANGVTYATSGVADFAEYFRKDPNQNIEFGSVMCLNESGFAVLCNSLNSQILGIASERPAFLGGENLGDGSIAVGLVGQVETFVSNVNGEIKPGDALTASDIPGVAVKAITAGQTIGKALKGYGGAGVGKILVSVNIGWYDPTIYIASDGTLGGVVQNTQNTQQAGESDISDSQTIGSTDTPSVPSSLEEDPLFKDLKDKVGSLESKLDLLNLQFDQQASISGLLASQGQALRSWEASASAALALGDLELNNATIAQDLIVLGHTTVTTLGVTGNINVGLLSIHGLDGEINTLAGALYLQKTGLGGVDILNGKIVIDTVGNMIVAQTITAGAIEASNYTVLGQESIGSGTIPTGATSIEVSTAIASSSSKIFLTATSLTDRQITVVEKSNGKFKVAIPASTTSPISFDWWIVGNKSN